MNTLVSAVAAPLPSFVRAAAFAVLAVAAVGTAELWQHKASADVAAPAAAAIDATQPLAAAPSTVDMWRF
ncbi:MAG: hypothetical protein JWO51_1770 [Rhodospirillales bacterium]|jgi:hypothetical protein|nr:hypothetical protein [Rhodospirillales bacterium]